MQTQVNTDNNIEGDEAMIASVRSTVEASLDRFSDRITRVEVHLSDENADKGGSDDIRCMIEARVEGRPPAVVTHDAASVDRAVDGAADKLTRVLESALGKLRDRRG